MQPKLALIIADDLTGACDAAVHFAVRGARTLVSVAGECGEADAIAVSTESRDCDEAAIAARIQALAHLRAPVIFKKIDSVLRGRPGFEIAEAIRAFGRETAVVTPAFPALGRRVRDGHLHVDGLRETVDVAAKLRADGLGEAEEHCSFPDAATDEDLARVVEYGDRLKKRVLWVGSGGLASAVANRVCGPAWTPAEPPPRSGPVIYFLGSTHTATMAQQRHLLDARPATLLHADKAKRLAHDSHSVVRIERGVTPAERVAALLESAHPAAIVASGGDTVSLVCGAIGARAIDLRGEIVPGLPWGLIVGCRLDGVPIATKSGGFGAPDALVRVADWFTS